MMDTQVTIQTQDGSKIVAHIPSARPDRPMRGAPIAGSWELIDGRLVRTRRSMFLRDRRIVAKKDPRPLHYSAQDRADEKKLSRSKEYPHKTTITGSIRRRVARGV